MPARTGPGSDLHRLRAEVERRHDGHFRGPPGRPRGADAARPQASPRRELRRGGNVWPRRGLRVQPRPRGRVGQSGVPVRRAAILRADRPRIRSGIAPPAGRDSCEAPARPLALSVGESEFLFFVVTLPITRYSAAASHFYLFILGGCIVIRNVWMCAVVVGAWLAASGDARGQLIFQAILNGAQEPPSGSGSPATGFGVFNLNATQTELTWSVTYSGLTG